MTLVMSLEKALELGLKPKAYFRGFTVAGCQPDEMGIGPVYSVPKLLEARGLKIEDIDLWELNEAFAAQSLGVLAELKIDAELVNVNGGAVALGHPIGASGARVLVTLLHAMKNRDVALGLASLCIGGGQGIAMIVERA